MALADPLFLHTKMATADAIDFRRAALDGPLQPGVVAGTDFQVAQTGAASMNVLVAAGSAWVLGTTVSRQGLYQAYNNAQVSVAVPANSSGNPRVDQLVLRIYDSADALQGQDVAALEIVQGTPTAGTTLDSRAGALAIPASSLRLADILVPNAAASIPTANIRDRRPWARGASYSLYIGNLTNSVATSTFESQQFPAVRLEIASGLVEAFLNVVDNYPTSGTISYRLLDGGIQPSEFPNMAFPVNFGSLAGHTIRFGRDNGAPAATGSYLQTGNHVFQWQRSINITGSTSTNGMISFREIVAQNALNGTT